jgi:hypothetical protein
MSVNDVDRAADLVLRLDGPYEHDDLAAAASLVSELVRRLNHATRSTTHPTTVDAVAARIATAVASLPQLCTQLAHSLTRVADDPALASDTPSLDPAALAHAAAEQLQDAAGRLASVSSLLSDVTRCTARLYERS